MEIPSFPPSPGLTSYLRLPPRWPREILGGPARSGGQGNPSASLSTSWATSRNSSQEEDCSGSGLVSDAGPRPVGEGAWEAGQPVHHFPDSEHPSRPPPATRPLLPPPCHLVTCPLHRSSTLGRFPRFYITDFKVRQAKSRGRPFNTHSNTPGAHFKQLPWQSTVPGFQDGPPRLNSSLTALFPTRGSHL